MKNDRRVSFENPPIVGGEVALGAHMIVRRERAHGAWLPLMDSP